MAKPEWGRKHLCGSCGTKFYDMRRSPVLCPSCGAKVEASASGRGGRKLRGAAAKSSSSAAAAPAYEAEAEAESVVLDETATEAAPYEDAGGDKDSTDEYGDVIEDADELSEEGALNEVVEGDGDEDT